MLILKLKETKSQKLLLQCTVSWLTVVVQFKVMLLTVISPSLLYQIVGKLALNLISPNFFFFSFMFYKYLSFLFSHWSISLMQSYWLSLFTLESADKLFIRAEFSISLFLVLLRSQVLFAKWLNLSFLQLTFTSLRPTLATEHSLSALPIITLLADR